jgi:hypothetical protein
MPAKKKRSVTKAKQFWKTLAKEAPKLHSDVFAKGLTIAHNDRVGELVEAAGFSFLTEMTTEGSELVLIFTPEWNLEVAEDIDWFVSLAPAIPNWKIYTRRQRTEAEFALELVEAALQADVSDAKFSVVEVEGGLHVTMHSQDWDEFNSDGREFCVRFFLSHALGEQKMMDHVVSVALAPPAKTAKLLTPEKMVQTVLAHGAVASN